jgi:arginyl-tRNA synthetase
LTFDLELAKKQSNENPVFMSNMPMPGFAASIVMQGTGNRVAGIRGRWILICLTLEDELALVKALSRYPETVEGAARHCCEPHRVVFYLQDLAASFHSYYNKGRVLGDNIETSKARLYLVNGVRTGSAKCPFALGSFGAGDHVIRRFHE